MSDNRYNEKGQTHTRGLLSGTKLLSQKIKEWWSTKHGKIITIVASVAAIFYFALGIVDFINGFYELCENRGWDWCKAENGIIVLPDETIVVPPDETIVVSPDEPTVVPPPETIVQLAHRLFDNNNSANLQVEISPSILNVGESMYMHFKTNSDGYLLVLNINSQGALSQLIPRISQEKPSYLKLNKDQERIIPDPDDPYDLPRFVIEEPTGQEILIAILIKENELPLGIISALPFASNMQIEQIKNPLNDLYGKLEKSVSKTWSSQVFEYETFSSNKGD